MQNDAIGLVVETAAGVGFICVAVHAVSQGKLQMRDGNVWKRSEDPRWLSPAISRAIGLTGTGCTWSGRPILTIPDKRPVGDVPA